MAPCLHSFDGVPSLVERDPDDGRLFWIGLFDPLEAAVSAQNLSNPLRPDIAPAPALVAGEGDQDGEMAHA